jgi:iron transport multicopper oxidase
LLFFFFFLDVLHVLIHKDLDITAPIYYNISHTNFAPSQDVGMDSPFDDFKLAPYYKAMAVEPDHQVNLTIDFQVTTDGMNRGMFNELPYLSPLVPTTNTMLSMGNDSNNIEVYGPQTMAFILNHLDMVEVVLNNLDGNAHPLFVFPFYLKKKKLSKNKY